MSAAIRRAMQVTKATQPSTRFLLTMLVAHMNDDGLAWPGLRLLRRETALSKRTIQRGLDELVTLGEVVKFPKGHVPDAVTRAARRTPLGGWQQKDCYHVCILVPAQPFVVSHRPAKEVSPVAHLEGGQVVSPATRQVVSPCPKSGPRTSITEGSDLKETTNGRKAAERWIPILKKKAYEFLKDGLDEAQIRRALEAVCEEVHMPWTFATLEEAIARAAEMRARALATPRRPYQQHQRRA